MFFAVVILDFGVNCPFNLLLDDNVDFKFDLTLSQKKKCSKMCHIIL